MGIKFRVRIINIQRHFQQYFSHIVAVSFIGGGNRSTQYSGENHHLPQITDKFYVVSNRPSLSEIQTHNFSGDRH